MDVAGFFSLVRCFVVLTVCNVDIGMKMYEHMIMSIMYLYARPSPG